MTLCLGDRFELPVTRKAWESRRIPLTGDFRHLLDPTGEPIPVTLRGESGQSAVGVWDGEHGLLDVPGLRELASIAGTPGPLTFEVEEVQAPTFRVGHAGHADEDTPLDFSPREIGGVRVRFDPSAAEILSELAEGVHAPWKPTSLTDGPTRSASPPGFEELISLASPREVGA